MKEGHALKLPAASRGWASRHAAELLAAALLLLMAANMFSAVFRKGLTADEFYHIPAGYYHLTAGDFRINTEHPPPFKMLAAVPLLALGVEAPRPATADGALPRERTEQTLAAFWRANTGRFESVAFWARVPAILLTLVLGVVVYLFARRLFGRVAAALAVALFAFEPTVLAHGRVVQTDVPAALAYLLFFLALDSYLRAPTWRRALALGAALGLGLVTKFSLAVLAPVMLLTAAVLLVVGPRRGLMRGRVGGQALAAVLVALFIVNAVYFFERRPLSEGELSYVRAMSPETATAVEARLRAVSGVAPTAYAFGFYQVLIHNRNGHLASLVGRYGYEGWWLYFPVAFALKTTLPLLLVVGTALSWSVRRLAARREPEFLLLLAPAGLYAALAMSGRINIGVRHFLPVFPFLFVAGGAMLSRLPRPGGRRGLRMALMVAVLGWAAFEAARAHPDYVPYMNQLAWRRPHWYYLGDSNVEWGDDARALALYLRERGETRVRAALLDGVTFNEHTVEYVRTLDHYGIEYLNLLSDEEAAEETRYVAVGASYLNGALLLAVPVPQRMRVLEYRRRAPEKVFGGSIYLYREEP